MKSEQTALRCWVAAKRTRQSADGVKEGAACERKSCLGGVQPHRRCWVAAGDSVCRGEDRVQGEKGLSTRLHAHTQPQWLRYSIMNGSLLEDVHGLHWQWALVDEALKGASR